MASTGKQLLRVVRRARLSDEAPEGIGPMELLILFILSSKPLRDPATLATRLGLNARRVGKAWERLQGQGHIAPQSWQADDEEPRFEATASGRTIAYDALMAAEIAGFEPEELRSLRALDDNPLSHMNRPGGL